MYSTRTRVRARIPNGHRLEEKRARRTKVRGQVVEDRRPARGELNGPRARSRRGSPCWCRFRVGPVEFKLNEATLERWRVYSRYST